MFSIVRDVRRAAALLTTIAFLGLSAETHAASLTGTPRTSVQAGTWYKTRPTLNYTGSAQVTYQIANKPAWATFSRSTGKLAGLPTAADAGHYSNIVIAATVGRTKLYWPAFSIKVLSANQAPKIGGTPTTAIVADKAYVFQPHASDLEGAPLTFSILNKPTWASFSSSTGRLSGSPTAAATHSSIVIAVSDGKTSASLPAFSIVVTKPNSAPVITGTPSMSTFAGRAYSFNPSATDADGNKLTFSVQNKPSWATFDATTGVLSGTPTAAGQFSNIAVSVSDGTTSAALPPFTLTVSPTVLQTITLHWTPPDQNVDGTPLVDLAGFRVVYGTTPTAMNQTLELPDCEMISVQIEDLSSGTYYFAVKAYNTAGVESDLSEVLWKTIM